MSGKVSISRKRSNDPAQEHLREQKSLWNKSTTDLISKIIAFKRGLNGRGDPRAGLPASSIKEPLPGAIGSYLNHIASDYSALVDGAERIIQEQENYSKARRKTQPSVEKPPIPFAVNDGFVSEASWVGSQMWARLFNLRGPKKKFVVDMLRAGRSFREKLYDAENYLTSSDPNAVPKAFHIIAGFSIGPYKIMAQNYEKIVAASGMKFDHPPEKDESEKDKSEKDETENSKIIPTNILPATTKIPVKGDPSDVSSNVPSVSPEIPSNEVESLKSLLRIKGESHKIIAVVDYLRSISGSKLFDITPAQSFELGNLVEKINQNGLINGYIKNLQDGVALNENMQNSIQIIETSYTVLLGLCSSIINVPETNFNDLFKKINSSIKIKASHPLHPLVNLKKKWHQLKPDFMREDVDLDMLKESAFRHIDESLSLLDELMNELENSTEAEKILQPFQKFSNALADMFEDFVALGEQHNTHFRHEYRIDKSKSIVHMQIMERELNKVRRAIPGARAQSSKILINIPTGISAFT